MHVIDHLDRLVDRCDEADRWATKATRKSEVSGERGVPIETDNPFEPPATQ